LASATPLSQGKIDMNIEIDDGRSRVRITAE
jgi:hypothetical protein